MFIVCFLVHTVPNCVCSRVLLVRMVLVSAIGGRCITTDTLSHFFFAVTEHPLKDQLRLHMTGSINNKSVVVCDSVVYVLFIALLLLFIALF